MVKEISIIISSIKAQNNSLTIPIKFIKVTNNDISSIIRSLFNLALSEAVASILHDIFKIARIVPVAKKLLADSFFENLNFSRDKITNKPENIIYFACNVSGHSPSSGIFQLRFLQFLGCAPKLSVVVDCICIMFSGLLVILSLLKFKFSKNESAIQYLRRKYDANTVYNYRKFESTGQRVKKSQLEDSKMGCGPKRCTRNN